MFLQILLDVKKEKWNFLNQVLLVSTIAVFNLLFVFIGPMNCGNQIFYCIIMPIQPTLNIMEILIAWWIKMGQCFGCHLVISKRIANYN